MRRLRIGVIGAGALSEWGLLPTLLGTDALAPPDTGAWWSRRPSPSTSIRWQAPYRLEVVALCDADDEKIKRLATSWKIPAQYSRALDLILQNPLDVVFCENAAREDLPELVSMMARSGARFLWLGGAPAVNAGDALELAHWAAAHGVRLWSGRTLRHAAAHRAAIQLVKRGEIGDVTALALRWSTPFCAAPEADSDLRAATFAALDLLSACAGATPQSALLSEAKSTSHLWLSFTGGATATAIFASADNWNSPLPRLEICGTQGRSLVCEAGRRMGFYQPHEATRWIEPPGLAVHVSSANINGLAEDIKHFLTECSSQNNAQNGASSNVTGTTKHNENSDWLEVARVLAAGEAARASLISGVPVALEKLQFQTGSSGGETRSPSTPAPSPTLTLPLNL